ncbi:MAG: hydrogenase maturation nickel metallochaperone HypA [Candidatus Omnitrophica bacterium]|nr:hydrogenase maturation nickel metallochaperone HypA [Candidatus Omnitrophota bacterium]
MHDTHILKNIFRYLESEETAASKKIKRVHISLSEFGSITKEHFMEHYREASKGTRWEGLELELSTVPYGPELEIKKIEFAKS